MMDLEMVFSNDWGLNSILVLTPIDPDYTQYQSFQDDGIHFQYWIFIITDVYNWIKLKTIDCFQGLFLFILMFSYNLFDCYSSIREEEDELWCNGSL